MNGDRNLTPERGPSVWDRDDWNPAQPHGGSQGEGSQRWLLGIGGATVAIAGVALAAYGGNLVRKATTRRRPHDAALTDAPERDALTAQPAAGSDVYGLEAEHPLGATRDQVGDESAQSFPASDAPSYGPTIGATPDGRSNRKGPRPKGPEALGE